MAGSSSATGNDPRRQRILSALVVLCAAIALSLVFWWRLWTGGGLVGSDIYAYFLPQKAFFAEELQQGRLPVWNNRLGWGYPQIAESQTGVFYPLHLPLYYGLELNTAYNASQLLHYVLAFVFAWLYGRRVGLARCGAALAALVYTYGWFPSRICLEWAIIGGAWFPAALWCAESCIQTRHWRYGIWLTVVLGLQMLAGHFTLAFVTQLTVAAYIPLRLWFGHTEPDSSGIRGNKGLVMGLGLALVGGFLLAAVQLLPTWELKQQSQRKGVSSEHDPGYGYLPAPYLTQVVAPWYWYADEAHFTATVQPGGSRTNRVEAHLYFGLVPLALAVWGAVSGRIQADRRLLIWIALGAAAAIYATGVLIPITRYLPGFSFFEGPARFGIVSTFAAGLWAGFGLDRLLPRVRRSRRWGLGILIFVVSIGDLWIVSREVTYAYPVDRPPLADLPDTPLRKALSESGDRVRLFSPGKNLPSMLGMSTLPIYLGLGPAAYFDPEQMLPGDFDFESIPSAMQIEWLRRSGVTHLLSFVPVERGAWPVDLGWQGADPFLNRALARGIGEPLFLYKLRGTRGRVAWEDAETNPPPKLIQGTPTRVEIATDAKRNDRLILTELTFPGWSVTIDGAEAQPQVVEGVFRGVDVPDGLHSIVWIYTSRTLYWGGGISLLTLACLLAVGHVRYWHPTLLAQLLQSERPPPNS